MADYNYQAAGQQHLAYLTQTQHRLPTHGDHNPWRAEAGLEAYLVQRQVLVHHPHLRRAQVSEPHLPLAQNLQMWSQDLVEKKPHHP